ncbi:hypothetical protein NMY22_g10148 [Coprinellus aureogranulatus]|nr:hypothetical protein NMY22_g10148 [Coprinellus aureogranulatus]
MTLSFPNEVLSRIVWEAVYSDEDFRVTLARDPLHHAALTTGPAHGSVTKKMALVNRQFHAVAVEELWRYVSVRSSAAIKAVAALVAKYGRHTERIDFRIREPYAPYLTGEIMKHMPKLKVVMISEPYLPALTRPLVKRIDFEGQRELPSPVILRELLNENPQLISLRVVDSFVSGIGETDWSGSAPLTGDSRLQELSLGSDYARSLSEHSPHGLDAFVDMLCVWQPALNHLKTIHIKQFTPRMYKLLQLYGPALRHLTLECPNLYSNPLHDRNLVNLCPALETVVWYITDCGAIEPSDCIPLYHPNIQLARIVYNNPASFLPHNYTKCLRDMLRLVLDREFPKLQDVTVKLRGFATRDLPNKEWFCELQGEYAAAGISLRGS